MNTSYGQVKVTTLVATDGIDMGSHTAPRAVQVTVTDRSDEDEEVSISFDLDPQAAHDLGAALLRNAWDADKDALRQRGETYRRLGFFH